MRTRLVCILVLAGLMTQCAAQSAFTPSDVTVGDPSAFTPNDVPWATRT